MKVKILLFLNIIFCFSSARSQTRPPFSITEMEKEQFKIIESEKEYNSIRFHQSGASAANFTTASENFDVHYYRCEWQIDPAVRAIAGKVTSYFTITSPANSIIYDLSDTLNVDSVTYHQLPISFQRLAGDGLQINFPSTVPGNTLDSVSIYYKGFPRQRVGFGAFYQYDRGGVPVIQTLSEPYGSKEWWPCKNGLNDKADSVELIITSPAAFRASSNGLLLGERTVGPNRICHFKHRYPIASYLVAIAVSNYTINIDTVQVGNITYPFISYAYPEYTPGFFDMESFSKTAFRVYTQLVGDYPFAREKYGHTQFGFGGGEEHQTNSFVDYPTPVLSAHELAHQWFGDKVTCGSWKDIWLNEGFATYFADLFLENAYPDYFPIYLQRTINSVVSKPDGSVYVNDTSDFRRIFDGRLSYNKGAMAIHMLRWKMGDAAFFKGLRQYLNDPALQYGFARTGDLQRNLELSSGTNLQTFFQKWIYGQGYPSYSIQWAQDSSNILWLKMNQATSHASVSFYEMPVPIEFRNSSRDTIIVFDHIKSGQTFLAQPGFRADTAIFDPSLWLLSAKNSLSKAPCSNVSDNNLFPFYNIKWSQNNNHWVYVDIRQTNPSPHPLASTIPLYLHLAGSGKDTSIAIQGLPSQYNSWVNAGFTVTNVFVNSASCLLSNAFQIQQNANSTLVNDIRIYPVPASGDHLTISIKNPSDKILSVQIFNASGQLLYQNQFKTPGRDELFTVPTEGLPSGVYIIKFLGESATLVTKKFIR